MATIADLFPDPYDPNQSFWVHDDLGKLKSYFIEADKWLEAEEYAYAKEAIKVIAEKLPLKARRWFYKRCLYNSMYLRYAGRPVIGRYKLPAGFAEQFLPQAKAHFAGEIRHSKVKLPASLKALRHESAKASRKIYGWDFLHTDISVRYANDRNQSPMPCDKPDDVNERLLSAMHVDQKKGLTSIVYLTDVTEETGCFSYLDGSHMIRQSPTIRAMHETIKFDLKILSRQAMGDNNIPVELFGSTACWEFLPTKKRDIARPFLVKHLGPPGTSISFTGNILVHSGGYPIKGERIALFIAHAGVFFQRIRPLLPYCIEGSG